MSVSESEERLEKQPKQWEGNNMNTRSTKIKRQLRIRKKLFGTKERPRLSVYRSNNHVYAQIINDEVHSTIVGISEKVLSLGKNKMTKIEVARMLGKKLAEEAKGKKVNIVIFDKGPYAYHGRVKALAEGAREGGLQF